MINLKNYKIQTENITRIDQYDYLFKTVLVGDSGVGKTQLISQFSVKKFDPTLKTTIGVEFKTKCITINRKNVKVQLWDTAGSERYRAVTSAYYRGAAGALVVYDITNEKSFENLDYWISELRKYRVFC